MKLKQALEKKLTKKELSILRTAYDIIGKIAVIEIPEELVKKEKMIGGAILKINKNVETVAKKASIHAGEYRLQKYKIIAGKKKKETEHKENNVRLKLHIEKTYFSSRLSTERKRIMGFVKPGESVLVMFSGAAPYVCVIAKNTDAKEVYGVEINPEAHKYALENVRINKLDNVKLFVGNVREVVPRLVGQGKKFDRIIMPLPMHAEDFLDVAFKAAKKNCVIHSYDFGYEEELPNVALDKIDEVAKREGVKYKILGWNKCGQYSPRNYRVCVDFKLL